MSPEDKEKLIKTAQARADFREKLRNDPKGAAADIGINLSDEDLQQLRDGLSDDEDDRVLDIIVASASRGKKKPKGKVGK